MSTQVKTDKNPTSKSYSRFKKGLSELRSIVGSTIRDQYNSKRFDILGKFSIDEDSIAIYDSDADNVLAVIHRNRQIVRIRRDSPYATALQIPNVNVVLSETLDEHDQQAERTRQTMYIRKVAGPQKIVISKLREQVTVKLDLGERKDYRLSVFSNILASLEGDTYMEAVVVYEKLRTAKRVGRYASITFIPSRGGLHYRFEPMNISTSIGNSTFR